MGGYLSLPILFVVVLIQATIMPELRFSSAVPDLVLAFVVTITLIAGLELGLIWAAVGGVLQDLLSAVPMGTSTLALTVVVVVVVVMFRQAGPRSLFYPPLAAMVGSVVVQVVTYSVLAATGHILPLTGVLLTIILPGIVLNAVLILPVYRMVSVFYASSRPQRMEGL